MVARRIVRVDVESDGACVVVLECGHRRHVRDRPPLERHPWVRTEAGRASRIGERIECGLCDGA